MMHIAGILNLSTDSFSGEQPSDPIAHGEQLVADGADWLDVGAEASNISSMRVPAETEIARLTPVVRHFVARDVRVAIDTTKPEVFAAMEALGATMWNDVSALGAPGSLATAAHSKALLVLMFRRTPSDVPVMPEMIRFFQTRIGDAMTAGITRDRLILDPGMGNFLSLSPAASVDALRSLSELSAFGLPLYLCTSRKSFLAALTRQQPPLERSAATLASELFAAQQPGVRYIRTHDVRALKDALSVWRALGT